jgi:hypothetical protein
MLQTKEVGHNIGDAEDILLETEWWASRVSPRTATDRILRRSSSDIKVVKDAADRLAKSMINPDSQIVRD